MSASLEARQQAIAEALRAVAAEGEQRSRAIEIERRLDELSSRLAAVETLLLEDAWGRPPAAPVSDPRATPAVENDVDERVSVPAVPLSEGRMSSVASRVLFGH